MDRKREEERERETDSMFSDLIRKAKEQTERKLKTWVVINKELSK